MLWAYVTLNRTYDDYLEVPLRVSAPVNQALLSVPHSVLLRIRGTGWQILNAHLFSPLSEAIIDLNTVPSADGVVYTVSKAEIIRSVSMTQPVQKIDVQPPSLTFRTGEVIYRTVPVAVRSSISTRPGFIIVGKPTARPNKVELRGGASVVDNIERWPTQRLGLENLFVSTDIAVSLLDTLSDVVTVNPRRVNVSVNVQQEADITITDVVLDVRQEHDHRTLICYPDRVSVTVRGGVFDLAELTAGDIQAVIPSVLPRSTPLSKPHIKLPPNIHLVAVHPPVIRLVERLN